MYYPHYRPKAPYFRVCVCIIVYDMRVKVVLRISRNYLYFVLFVFLFRTNHLVFVMNMILLVSKCMSSGHQKSK